MAHRHRYHIVTDQSDRGCRPGETLATRIPAVIQRWAVERGAVPATVPGTEHEGRPGVLALDFPGFKEKGLQPISWEEWFKTFQARHLWFLYQERLRDGRPSNFYKVVPAQYVEEAAPAQSM